MFVYVPAFGRERESIRACKLSVVMSATLSLVFVGGCDWLESLGMSAQGSDLSIKLGN